MAYLSIPSVSDYNNTNIQIPWLAPALTRSQFVSVVECPLNVSHRTCTLRTGIIRQCHKGAWITGRLPMHAARYLVDRPPSVSVFNSQRRPMITRGLIDYMIYTRASEDDWNRFASVTADDGWNWDSILPYAKKVCLIVRYRRTRLIIHPIHTISLARRFSKLTQCPECVLQIHRCRPRYQWSCRRRTPSSFLGY